MTSRLSIKVDAGVGAFSVSPSGRDIALASQNGLFILDLNTPYTPPRWLPLHTIWEVADVQWCHHPSHPTWLVSTSNQKAILWNLALPSHRAIEHVLHGHNRAITDINFSLIRRDVLATCSVDTRVLVWDTRNTTKPAITFADFDAGATQVRWNKINQHVLASAHHRRIVVWDDRRNNIPLYSVEAHTGQVNGLDWEFKSANRILSCSTDREAKVWDLNVSTTEPMTQITTTFPIWRAKYMPRGPGCLIAPLRGGDNSAYLVDVKDADSKADLTSITKLTFTGHTEPIKEIGLRREGNGFELVSLSNDQHLNLWPITREDLTLVEFPVEEMPPFPNRSVTFHDEPVSSHSLNSKENDSFKPLLIRDESRRDGHGHLDWISRVQVAPDSTLDKRTVPEGHANLSKEVTRMGTKFPKLCFEQIDLTAGTCTLTLRGPWAPKEELTTLRVTFTFPVEYPAEPLGVMLEEHLAIEPAQFAALEAHIKLATDKLAEHAQSSFEYCLRYLMGDRVSLDLMLHEDDANSAFGLSDSDMEPLAGDSRPETPPSEGENSDDENDFLYADGTQQNVVAVEEEMADNNKPQMDSTPLPKQCGAVWTSRGLLLCFFNQSRDKPSFQRPLPLDRIFGGDESDSDDMYESDSEEFGPDDPSSRNWSSTAVKLTIMTRFNGYGSPSDGTGTGGRRRDSLGTGSHTSLSGQTNNLGARNHVETADFSHLIPSSPLLAEQYSLDIGRDPVELASANAEVAEKAGRHFDAYLWRFVLYLTTSDEPFDPSAVFAGFSGFTITEPVWDWTGSPYGGMYVGAHLISYLEKTQNIQLIASLSSLFVEVCYGPYRGFPTMPVLRKTCPGQQASGEMLYTLRMATNAQVGAQIDVTVTSAQSRPPSNVGCELLTTRMRADGSKTPVISSVPRAGFSLGPPSDSTIVSETPSPDRSLPSFQVRRTDSTVSYPASLSSGATTPYGSQPKSSAEIDSNQLGFFDYASTRPRLKRNLSSGSRSDVGNGSSNSVPTLRSPGVAVIETNIRLVNKTPYSSECIGNHTSAEEFATIFEGFQEKFALYRALYAQLLDAWGLYDKRLELLKHNYYKQSREKVSKPPCDEYQAVVELADADQPGGRDARQCRFCHRTISKQFVQCKNCNHIMHRVCADEWWGESSGDECPSGCGCKCLEYI